MEYAISLSTLPHLRIIGRMNYPRGWHRSTRCRFNIIFFMHSGEFVFELASGETVALSDSCALFVPAGTFYRVSCTRDCEYSYVHFSTDTAVAQKDESAPSDDGTVILPRLLDLSSDGEGRERIVRRLLRLERAFSSGEMYATVKTSCETASFILSVADIYARGEREPLPHALSLACEYVRTNIRESVTLSELADVCGITRQYLMRLFRTHTGMTATDYIHRTKLAYSLDLLKSTDMTVDEIAYQLGYCGSHYFCRVFRKYLGRTPTEYRRYVSDVGEL